MNLPPSQTFMLPTGINVKKINAVLKDSNMTLMGNACEPEEGTVLDTFDAAVYNSDALLIQTQSDLVRICWSGDVTVQTAPESEWQFCPGASPGSCQGSAFGSIAFAGVYTGRPGGHHPGYITSAG